MVNDPVLIFAVIVGLLLTATYIFLGRRYKSKILLYNVVVFFLCSSGIAAGFKVCLFALQSSVLKELEDERLYVFIGGLAVIWVSIITVAQPFSASAPPE